MLSCRLASRRAVFDRPRPAWGWAVKAALTPFARTLPTPEAVTHVAKMAGEGLRFHDLRHSYATHLVSKRVPINDVRAVMGHEQASTTLDLYTHASQGRDGRGPGGVR